MTDAIMAGVHQLSQFSVAGSEEATRHWSCEEFMNAVPTLKSTLIDMSTTQGVLTDRRAFISMCEQAREFASGRGGGEKYVGVIVTKPPETVCVFIPPAHSRLNYYLYDPHSRPHQGLNGSYIFETDKVDELVKRLQMLFPPLPMDDMGFGGGEADLMSMMYNSFDASFFMAADVPGVPAPSPAPAQAPAQAQGASAAVVAEPNTQMQMMEDGDFVMVAPSTPEDATYQHISRSPAESKTNNNSNESK